MKRNGLAGEPGPGKKASTEGRILSPSIVRTPFAKTFRLHVHGNVAVKVARPLSRYYQTIFSLLIYFKIRQLKIINPIQFLQYRILDFVIYKMK